MHVQILPDLKESRWLYNGSTLLQDGRHANVPAQSWVWRVTNDEGYGEYHNTYTVYVDEVHDLHTHNMIVHCITPCCLATFLHCF